MLPRFSFEIEHPTVQVDGWIAWPKYYLPPACDAPNVRFSERRIPES